MCVTKRNYAHFIRLSCNSLNIQLALLTSADTYYSVRGLDTVELAYNDTRGLLCYRELILLGYVTHS